MSFKELIKRTNNVRRKRDIILLSELLDIYEEYHKSHKLEPINPIHVFNELGDSLVYSEEEIKLIIQQAQMLRNEQNQN